MANSGIAEPAKKYAQRRSQAYSPGARKAQNWYSHSGDERITPAMIAIFRRRKNASKMPVTNSWQPFALPPVTWTWVVRLRRQYGASMNCQMCGYRYQPAIAPAVMNSTIL